MTGEAASNQLSDVQHTATTRHVRCEQETRRILQRSMARGKRLCATVLFALPLTIACGARTTEQRGGESHFLQGCGSSDCGSGLECIGGVCTQSCESNAPCRQLENSARCVEHRGNSVCDVECQNNGACVALGDEFACTGGACRVASARDAAPTYTATDAPSVMGPDAGTPANASDSSDPMPSGGVTPPEITGCRYAFVEYQEGDQIPSGSCETCACQSDNIVCEPNPDANCVEYGLPVTPCPEQEVVSDPIDVQFAYIDGDSVFIDATHSAGCAPHDYAVCYGYFLESYPAQNRLRLIHDAHGNDCEALASVQLQFDLRPLATADDSDTGVIVTPFGTYAYGRLACEERSLAASAQLDNVLSQLDLTCSTDEECELAPVRTDCFEACDTAVSLRETHFAGDAAMSSKDVLERELARIDASCSTFETDCGEPESGVACSVLDACPLACDSGNTARCIDSVCQLVEE
jgi:hypothetical protein